MDWITNRRLCGALGAGLAVFVVGIVAVIGMAVFNTPTVAAQLVLIGVAGVLDLVAAFENPVTARIDWFRLGGAANVALGLALPVGVLGWGSSGAGGELLVAVTAVGGIALAAIGLDLAVYAGAHIYERPLDADDGGRSTTD